MGHPLGDAGGPALAFCHSSTGCAFPRSDSQAHPHTGNASGKDGITNCSSTGRAFMEQAPWLAIFPGLAISLAVLGFNLFGDTLRDIWDPKLRGRG